ncbi:unnamed protein product [Rhizoctonia solani]|uniref:DUF6535 domain-containing protein n=1 Tax=Rhizoctonia solani TaxID=456999 RepID=A0A8H3G8U2_9AGAM|nr:unnamed protein product [Rhizoctonia solani]
MDIPILDSVPRVRRRTSRSGAYAYDRLDDNVPLRPQATRDKLASEDFGKELNPDSSIWKLYVEESKEQDNELTDGCNKDLDTLLLFATLFSAILTAFLVESTQLLQSDPSETSLELLLALAQSQRRIEIGAPDTLLPPIETTPFQPSGSARLINTLWFSALVISLGAAMVAILAKEWLGAFTSYKTRDPYQYTLQRQARFRSLESWGMLPIINFLPTILNFSLLLFALGLIVRLWTLDQVVAGVVTVLSTLVSLSYGGFTILGAAVDTCPYRSRISVYIGMIWPLFKSSRASFSKPSTANEKSYVKPVDLDSLSWLLDNSRDPTTADYTCQALAGLKSLKLDPSVFIMQSDQSFISVRQSNATAWKNILRMGAHIADRFSIMTTKYRDELIAFGGKNAARYAIALSEIYPFALAWLQRLSATDEIEGNHDLISDMQNDAHKITTSIFVALDLFWGQASPPLTVSSYCSLAFAELKLIEGILAHRRMLGHSAASSSGHTFVSVRGAEESSPLELQNRYRSTLNRISILIQALLDDPASTGNLPAHSQIHDLVLVVIQLVGHEEIRINGGFDYKTYAYNEDTQIMAVDTPGSYGPYRSLNNERTGLIGSLMKLFSSWNADNHIDVTNPRYRQRFLRAAMKLMQIIGPKSIEQSASNSGSTQCPSFFDNSSDPEATVKLPASPRESIVYQCLEMASFAIFFLGQPDMGDMVRILDAALTPLITDRDGPEILGHRFLHTVILRNPSLFLDWIKKLQTYKPAAEIIAAIYPTYVPNTQQILKAQVCWSITKLLTAQSSSGSTVASGLLNYFEQVVDHSAHLIAILKLLRNAGSAYRSSEATGKVLRNLTEHITTTSSGFSVPTTGAKNPCSACLDYFTQEKGFRLLQKIGSSQPEAAAQAVLDIVIQSVASRKQLGVGVVDSFLEAVNLVCESYPDNSNRLSNSFVPAVIHHLQQLEPGLESLVSEGAIPSIQLALDELYDAAQHMSITASKNQALSDLDSMIELVQKYSPMTRSLPLPHDDYPGPIYLPSAARGGAKRRNRSFRHSRRRRGTRDTASSTIEPGMERKNTGGSRDESGEDVATESKMRSEVARPSLGLISVASDIPEVPFESPLRDED